MTGDGWYVTGDIGAIDADGFLRITDRKKHLIITAGGKNLAPANIENAIKNQDPLVSQVYAHGDKRPFVVALVLHWMAVGFGISQPEHVKTIATLADGVIVASIFIRLMEMKGKDAVIELARELRAACGDKA